jgi:hypothetical protein
MSDYADRIETLADRAARERAAFQRPADPPDEDRAMEYLREGVGPAVAVYVDARTGDWHRFEASAFESLESTMNTYLELYAACYGTDIDASFAVTEAAELLVDTHNIRDVAAMLTHVPDRHDGQ